MMKKSAILLLLLFAALAAGAQPFYRKPVAPVRNVIVMIPDGTSTSVLAAARWYKFYNDPSQRTLNLDSCLCGLVGSFSSDSPIPCSAPAMSAYMTGMPQQAGNVSVYPAANPAQDIVEVESGRACQPLATLLEAAKHDRGKAAGLVVTVDFCHATPAACASHHYSRHAYPALAAQMAANDLDVMFGGGRKQVTDAMRAYLRGSGATLIEQDAAAFRAYDGKGPVWSLFAQGNMSYDLDRNDAEQPSLAEMTAKALEVLGRDGKTVVLEIDPPVDEIARRRQGFYQRCGFAVNPYPHVHPPYRPEYPGHELVVLSSPRALTPAEYGAFACYLSAVVMA